MRIARVLAASLTTFGLVTTAFADAGADLTVSTSVVQSCTIAGNTLAFPAYNTVSGASVDGAATIAVACTSGTETAITLGEGEHPAALSAPEAPARRMSDGGTNYLSYQLFADSNRSTVWGGTEATGKPYEALSSASSNQTVYGRIDAGQDVPAGDFTDTVLATILF